MPDRIHLGALGTGLAAHRLLAVEGVQGAGNTNRRSVFVDQWGAEWRLRHGVGTKVRQLVGLGLGIGEIGRTTLPGSWAKRIGHAQLVASGPWRGRGLCMDELRQSKEGDRREQCTSDGSAWHENLPQEMRVTMTLQAAGYRR